MYPMSRLLERDITTPSSLSFSVLVIELDSGPVFLAGNRSSLGDDLIHPAVLSFGTVTVGGFSVELEQQALPEYADGWWINRAAVLLEVTPDMESVYDGIPRFDGRIDSEPTERGGILSFSVVPYRKIVKTLPGLGLIDATSWPLANDAAMGAQKPMIFGTVENCPLLAVQVQPSTVLTVSALPNVAQLEVADTTDLAASGSVIIDGITYSYTHKDDRLLLGMTITRGHAAGTLVAQAGNNVYLAAGEAVSIITDIRANDAWIDGGTVDLSAATVTFTSQPTVVTSATRYTLDEHFDAIHASNTASNPGNAIRYGTVQPAQTGTPSGTVTAASPGSIVFARPVDGNRIISGAYSVQFSVAVGSQIGWAHVKIGNDVVWTYDPGVGVVYNASPAAAIIDDDIDSIPVSVEVESGGSTNQVTVTIVTAARVAVTGNLDEANYATVAPGQALMVTQTDTPPNRGPIANARLVVRWFATDAAFGVTAVAFGGSALGKLALTGNSGVSINKTVTVNSVTQGSAAFPTTSVSTSATKTDSSVNVIVNFPIAYTVAEVNVNRFIYLHPIDVSIGLPLGVVAGTYTFTLYLNPQGTAGLSAQSVYEVGGQQQTLYTATPPTSLSFSVPLTAGQLSVRVRHFQLGLRYPYDWIASTMHATISSVSASVTTKPTLNAVAVTAASSDLSAANLTNSGIAVSLSNSQIQLTVPAPPRVVNTTFNLPGYTDWSHFANKTLSISLTGTGASLCIVETYLQIEYDEIVYSAADNITATVAGRSGNPADVIATLAEASGETVVIADQTRLEAWCLANSMTFARRLADPTDALQLLTFAAEQAACDLYPNSAGLIMRRWDDEACQITAVADEDLLDVATVSWTERVETDITLAYREDYINGNGMTRVVTATAADNVTCAQTVTAMQVTTPIELEVGWLRSDAAAALLLAAYVRRYAVMRRSSTLNLPYGFGDVEAGDLIDWRDTFWRVQSASTDNGWISLMLEERPIS